ncbi:hypothetical protein PHYPSEUDO_013134 [Phytophthora pseudosyringae]|uniref:Phospholipase D n=1 Tax=Phytophthora pseudosyringae TaxID=221518 RepID=A0A8T1V8F9_9STRA|nr:hypothetical protein PHYPSEUDO_013134 [Phytophthora pseudosyringae]
MRHPESNAFAVPFSALEHGLNQSKRHRDHQNALQCERYKRTAKSTKKKPSQTPKKKPARKLRSTTTQRLDDKPGYAAIDGCGDDAEFRRDANEEELIPGEQCYHEADTGGQLDVGAEQTTAAATKTSQTLRSCDTGDIPDHRSQEPLYTPGVDRAQASDIPTECQGPAYKCAAMTSAQLPHVVYVFLHATPVAVGSHVELCTTQQASQNACGCVAADCTATLSPMTFQGLGDDLLDFDNPEYEKIQPIDYASSNTTSNFGNQNTQIVRTFSCIYKHYKEFAPRGEQSLFRARIKALKKAKNFIYVEDQYFIYVPELFDALMEVLPRIQRLVVVVQPPDALLKASGYGRYIYDVSSVYVSLGSANWNRRSMTFDSELNANVIDDETVESPDGITVLKLVRDMRIRKFVEMTGLSYKKLNAMKFVDAADTFKVAAKDESTILTDFSVSYSTKPSSASSVSRLTPKKCAASRTLVPRGISNKVECSNL